MPPLGPGALRHYHDPERTPVATIILEQKWLPNSAICAKAINVGLYNPKAPSTANPSATNPHYWTNDPHPTFKITSPIWMRIPRNETGNPDAIDDPTRHERYLKEDKEDWLPVKGNWTVRDFPPGKGLTNQAADINCFTQQKVDIFWTAFFLDPSPIDFSARPDA